MVATLVLLVSLAIAAWTDARRNMIYNWTTYPGVALGLAGQWIDGGGTAVEDGVQGLAVCGGILLFLFLLGGIGGGDVKLMAMIGAALGLHEGIEAMLWTFVLGAILALSILVWQFGAIQLIRKAVTHAGYVARARSWVPLTAAERAPLQRTTFLAPAALLAVLIVRWDALHDLLRT